jgi:hypothetical protein
LLVIHGKGFVMKRLLLMNLLLCSALQGQGATAAVAVPVKAIKEAPGTVEVAGLLAQMAKLFEAGDMVAQQPLISRLNELLAPVREQEPEAYRGCLMRYMVHSGTNCPCGIPH